MFYPIDDNSIGDLAGYTCVVPTVSIGNVGQLAVDLLISSLDCEQIGTIFHKAIVPLFGSNAFDNSNPRPTTAVDVFVCTPLKLMFIQIRSSIVRRHRQAFFTEFSNWLESLKVEKLLVLSSLDAVQRHDKAIMTPNQVYFKLGGVSAETNSDVSTTLSNLGALEFSKAPLKEEWLVSD